MLPPTALQASLPLAPYLSLTHSLAPTTLRIALAVAVGIWILSAQGVFCQIYQYAVDSACSSADQGMDQGLMGRRLSSPIDGMISSSTADTVEYAFPAALGAISAIAPHFLRHSANAGAHVEASRVLSETSASTHSVSDGIFSSPYYTISPALPAQLSAGTTYTFNAAGVATSHPFAVGTGRGSIPTWVTGDTSGMTGSTGTITVAIPSDYTGNVVYYCTLHGSMTETLSVTGGGGTTPPPSEGNVTATAAPPAPPTGCGCPSVWLSDGQCDSVCNTAECNYDEADVRVARPPRSQPLEKLEPLEASALAVTQRPCLASLRAQRRKMLLRLLNARANAPLPRVRVLMHLCPVCVSAVWCRRHQYWQRQQQHGGRDLRAVRASACGPLPGLRLAHWHGLVHHPLPEHPGRDLHHRLLLRAQAHGGTRQRAGANVGCRYEHLDAPMKHEHLGIPMIS